MKPIAGSSLMNYTNWKIEKEIQGLLLAWGAGALQFERPAALPTMPAARSASSF
jgi:hypothetical protein